jgi:hypothetical protein
LALGKLLRAFPAFRRTQMPIASGCDNV